MDTTRQALSSNMRSRLRNNYNEDSRLIVTSVMLRLCSVLSVTVYTALNRSILPGQWVVISWSRRSGPSACQLASRGMGLAIAIDHEGKEALARKSGAEHFIDFTKLDKEGVTKHVRPRWVGWVHMLQSVQQQMQLTHKPLISPISAERWSGLWVSLRVKYKYWRCESRSHYHWQRTITGSAVGNRGEAIRTLEFAGRGIIKAHDEIDKPGEFD